MHIAASNDHVYVVEELIKHKAALDVFSGKGYTPLIMACSQGYTRVTQQLIDAGANVNVVSPLDGATALHHAVTGGFLACTQLLIASGKCDLTIQDNGQMTPEHCAHAMLEETRKKGDAAGVRTFQALVNYFATLGQQGNSKCAACFKALDPAERKRCGRCKAIWYCRYARVARFIVVLFGLNPLSILFAVLRAKRTTGLRTRASARTSELSPRSKTEESSQVHPRRRTHLPRTRESEKLVTRDRESHNN